LNEKMGRDPSVKGAYKRSLQSSRDFEVNLEGEDTYHRKPTAYNRGNKLGGKQAFLRREKRQLDFAEDGQVNNTSLKRELICAEMIVRKGRGGAYFGQVS